MSTLPARIAKAGSGQYDSMYDRHVVRRSSPCEGLERAMVELLGPPVLHRNFKGATKPPTAEVAAQKAARRMLPSLVCSALRSWPPCLHGKKRLCQHCARGLNKSGAKNDCSAAHVVELGGLLVDDQLICELRDLGGRPHLHDLSQSLLGWPRYFVVGLGVGIGFHSREPAWPSSARSVRD